MEVSTGSYVVTTVVGLIITVVVGRLLRPAGYDLLREVLGERSSTTSLNRLLVTLYYLFALGLLALVATTNPLGLDGVQLIITKTGIFLLTLGAVYGLTVLALVIVRDRRRTETLEDGFREL
ncbi:hypothetical protein [Actinomycetospora callitridis]|uniref:hypothetical protein n=1 Tax=Actinomycetospora callitridis TaxID=913944 RepID=UPI00236660C0|nr:hypothetical protein [Actinomycetospora callitridis]MDD7921444.1 hypothetical protein [Actinomycetospora callitridis]